MVEISEADDAEPTSEQKTVKASWLRAPRGTHGVMLSMSSRGGHAE